MQVRHPAAREPRGVVMATPATGALYGSTSLSWRFNSQAFVLMGGPRAAILQVCDPAVAAGVVDYSTYRTDTFGRLERTMESMLTIAFGTEDKRIETLERLDRIHSAVKGKTVEGEGYSAMDEALQYWVLATLTDTVIEVDRRYLGRMKRADRVVYYEESKRIATAFGISDGHIPDDYDDFRTYFRDRIATLEPTSQSREVAETLMHPNMRFVPGFAFAPLNLITLELLPTRMRRELRLRDLNPAELATVRGAQLSMRNAVAPVASGRVPNPFNSRVFTDAA
ncbi:MAG: oxygenase MpaB family protein [Microthrixaceae bacterium]